MTRIQCRSHGLRFQGLAASVGLGVAISGSALALSLGAPQTHSFLAEPLLLRLPLRLERQDANPANLQVRLLPASAYAALGYPPPGHDIADLQAEIVGNPQNGYWVSIHSTHVLREPVLSLLVELRSPGSSLIRSIDLLLDPPPAKARTSLATSHTPPAASSAPSPTVRRASAPAGLRTAPGAGFYGPVRPGESLSRIAERVRGDAKVPLTQLIDAIYASNPAAFDGSPDRLRTGITLLVPAIDAPASRPAHRAAESEAPAGAARPSNPAATGATETELHYLSGPLFALEWRLNSYPLEPAEGRAPARFQYDWQLSTVGDEAPAMTGGAPETEAFPGAAPDSPAAAAWLSAGDVMTEPELASQPLAGDIRAAPAHEAAEELAEAASPPAQAPASERTLVQDSTGRPTWPLLALAVLFSALLLIWRRRSAARSSGPDRSLSYRQPAAAPSPARVTSARLEQGQDTPTAADTPPAQPATNWHAPENSADRAEQTLIDPMQDTIVMQPDELEFDFPLDQEELREALSAETSGDNHGEQDEHEKRRAALHLRIRTLLADDPEPIIRRNAKLALACLDGGNTVEAEEIVQRLEAHSAEHKQDDDKSTDKIVSFPRQQQKH